MWWCTGGRLKLTCRFCLGSPFCCGAAPWAGCAASSCPALPGPGAEPAERSGSSLLVAGDRKGKPRGRRSSDRCLSVCCGSLLCTVMCLRSISRNCLHAAGRKMS